MSKMHFCTTWDHTHAHLLTSRWPPKNIQFCRAHQTVSPFDRSLLGCCGQFRRSLWRVYCILTGESTSKAEKSDNFGWRRDLSKGDTVWWALQNCMFLGYQRDMKIWACVWFRGCANLWSTSMSFLIYFRRRKGPAVPERDLQKYGRRDNRLATHSLKPRWCMWSTFSHLSQW